MVVVILGGKGADGIACASQFQSDRISQNTKRRVERRSSIPGSRSGRERKAPLTIRRQISFQADNEAKSGTTHRGSHRNLSGQLSTKWRRNRGLHSGNFVNNLSGVEFRCLVCSKIKHVIGVSLLWFERRLCERWRQVGENFAGSFVSWFERRASGFGGDKIGSQAVGKRRLRSQCFI